MKTEVKIFFIWFSICAGAIITFLGFVSTIVYIPALREGFNNFFNQDVQPTPFKYLWAGWLLALIVLSTLGGFIMPSVWEDGL